MKMLRETVKRGMCLTALLVLPWLQTLAQEADAAPFSGPHLSLRANLLRWATITPDLGVEYRFSERWSAWIGGSWTSWSWSDKDRRYALWEITPEVRYHIVGKKVYVGAQFKAGSFNYKFCLKARQGDLIGGGITFGYLYPLGKRMTLDVGAALGCLHADYDKYIVDNGHRVRSSRECSNYFGPTSLSLSLVYNFK